MRKITSATLSTLFLFALAANAAEDQVSDPLVPKEGVSAKRIGNKIDIFIDGEHFTSYLTEGKHKPVLYPVHGPTGAVMVRHYPNRDDVEGEAKDHVHHDSLWFDHGNVNGVDFWHYKKDNPGRILSEGVEMKECEDGKLCLHTKNKWVKGESEVVLRDERKIAFWEDGAGNRYIDFQVTLKATEGDVTFGDTKEGSMGIRMNPALRLRGEVAKGKAVNSEGVEGRDLWGKRAKWVDYWGPVEGETVGIAIMDHPSNPRHPTWWHARDYGLVAANPWGIHDFENKPAGTGDMTIKQGEEKTFRYLFVFHRGGPEETDVEGIYQTFAK